MKQKTKKLNKNNNAELIYCRFKFNFNVADAEYVFWGVPTVLQADVMLSSVGKLRYSRWRPRCLPQHEIFYFFQYLDSQLRYRFLR